jgi:hypothetical protein
MQERLKPSLSLSPPTGRIICTCGLAIDVVDAGRPLELRYDYAAWQGLCQAPALGGPCLCLTMTVMGSVGDGELLPH